jgi:hypothetical protein
MCVLPCLSIPYTQIYVNLKYLDHELAAPPVRYSKCRAIRKSVDDTNTTYLLEENDDILSEHVHRCLNMFVRRRPNISVDVRTCLKYLLDIL